MDSEEKKLVMTVPEAGKKLGLSREGSYQAARRGEIPTIRIGHLLKVPVVQFNRLLNGTKYTPPQRSRAVDDTTELA